MKKRRALTADIVGSGPDGNIDLKWRSHYQRLTELRNELIRVAADLKEATEPVKQSFSFGADAGRDAYDQAFTLGVISSEKTALYEIDQALERIRNGKYGVCEITGKPIEVERLAAIPWTRFSLEAQNELETKGHHEEVFQGSEGEKNQKR